MKLISDFTDYYDGEFNNYGPILRRNIMNGRTRLQDLKLLNVWFSTPFYGKVKDIVFDLTKFEYVIYNVIAPPKLVVYTDDYAHAGAGKELLYLEDALNLYPNKLCTVYQPTLDNDYNISLRWIAIGKYNILLKYSSPKAMGEWRSNSSFSKVEILKNLSVDEMELQLRDSEPFNNYRMFAIDFIPSMECLNAIDFNTSPGLSPLKDMYSPREIISMLEDYQPDNIFGS